MSSLSILSDHEFGPVQDIKIERTRGGTAKENRRSSANSAGAAAEPGAGGKAASGVSVMRAFWETAGQKAEKPRAGTHPLCPGGSEQYTGTQETMCDKLTKTIFGDKCQYVCVLGCALLTEGATRP